MKCHPIKLISYYEHTNEILLQMMAGNLRKAFAFEYDILDVLQTSTSRAFPWKSSSWKDRIVCPEQSVGHCPF